MTETLGKIISDPASAADNDVFDLLCDDTESRKQSRELVYGRRDENSVAIFKDKVAVRSNCLAVSENNADKHLATDDFAHLFQRYAAERAVFFDFQLDYLNSALGKGVAVEKTGVFEKTFDFKRRLSFGIYSH